MLGALPAKVVALFTSLPLVTAALLVTGTFDLALGFGSWGRGATIAVEVNGLFSEVGCT